MGSYPLADVIWKMALKNVSSHIIRWWEVFSQNGPTKIISFVRGYEVPKMGAEDGWKGPHESIQREGMLWETKTVVTGCRKVMKTI